MEDPPRAVVLHDFHRVSRKAEESALRRFQASAWLESFIGPLGLSDQPSEQDFVSCLRNGLVLCNLINKIQPGIVPKVIESHHNSSSPAYQYFENVRNFLVAMEELNVPAFEASDLERDFLDAGSTAKIVDCVLSLKAYHEWKQWSTGCGGTSVPAKHLKSPMILLTTSRGQTKVAPSSTVGPCRHLDMPVGNEKPPANENGNSKLEDPIIGALVDCMLESKENIDHKLLAAIRNGTKDSAKVFSKILANCLQGQLGEITEESPSTSILTESSTSSTAKCKLCCLKKGDCNHWKILELQEKDLSNLKVLLSTTKNEFEILQSHLQNDLHALEDKVQEISFAAVGYQRVIQENRDLYNTVQDLKGNIRVYCRIRPVFGSEISTIDYIGDDGSLVVLDPLKQHKDARKIFQFNRVFSSTSSQGEVYKETQPLIRSVMDGYNVCIFAYGQTGSGKTHTMSGPSGGSAKDMGINYLALNDLFEISCTRKDTVDYQIQVQMVEIYNEQVRDLLKESSSTTKLEIRTCTSNGGLTLPGATLHIVKSSMDVLELMKLGELHRCVSSTTMNHQSSRSHSILTVHVHGKDISGNILRSCLHLVDLAGSERVDKSEVTGDRLKEAQAINKSLSCLGDVITALAQKNSHIPYRNSKLTQLLQNSLGGHAKTLMFAHVSPEADSFGETISTLKFAQRVSTVELGAAQLNKESREVKELKEQVDTLKRQLASKANEVKMMTNRTPPRPRRMSIENLTVNPQRTPPRSRRLSIENPVAKSERTPPRSRRLSIENSTAKSDRTSPRSRRLSIENSVTKSERSPPRSRRLSIENSVSKPERTPPRSRRMSIENSAAKPERTPPRSRRLSIENASVKMEKPVNPDNKKLLKISGVEGNHRTDNISSRPRILSSEAANCGQNQLHNVGSENISSCDVNKAENLQYLAPSEDTCEDSCSDYGILQNAEVDVSSKSHSGASAAALGSPASVSRSRIIGTEARLRRPIHLLNTPECSFTPSDSSFPNKSPIGVAVMSTTKKRSQIRRSLHTIGKLINPPEKRSRQHPVATLSAANGNVKSPLGAKTRMLRRQSLTGGPTPELSRRSSLEGKPIVSGSNEKRNAKTPPPPVRASCRLNSQWL